MYVYSMTLQYDMLMTCDSFYFPTSSLAFEIMRLMFLSARWSTIVSFSSNMHFCNCFWSTFSKSDHWLSPSVNYFSINCLIVFWVPCLFLIGFKEELAYGGDKNKTFSVRCIAKLSYYVSCFLIFHCTTIGLGRGCYMNIHTHMYIYM